jgi:hypothetical protein
MRKNKNEMYLNEFIEKLEIIQKKIILKSKFKNSNIIET